MAKASEAFAIRHDIAATAEDVARIRRALDRFYTAVETAEPVADSYIQLHAGEAIRSAFVKHNPLSGQAHGTAMAMEEMPEAWPPKYRASVAFHLSPLLDEVIDS
ncbi:hypothetical protein [Sinorhizobium meliloti]|uniref:hypothetical protein n=1 Tax=Rhizobium meliloti TaxID=382 RepID=UPI000FD4E009|nr:hypothetical protein [Sinorhizobium meliloti]RVN85121.1 hypothetical protein CN101_23640 [Sinorhizobium meliloti]RVO61945.1 hypothetical protein CN094_13325 [Sinorhizobium meliloti]